jgi:hypothetical protein
MARINVVDHPRILQSVDGERRKVAEVAAEYGCTPAAIYALLNRLRRAVADGAPLAAEPAEPLVTSQPQEAGPTDAPNATDLFAVAAVPAPTPSAPATKPAKRRGQTAATVDRPPSVELSLAAPPPATMAEPALPRDVAITSVARPVATVTELSLRTPAKRSLGLGASAAKPGFGLVMRTAEGDENATPFRSLEDLLGAVKPILRAAARSPDAVWFSIQPIDLATLDSDAA